MINLYKCNGIINLYVIYVIKQFYYETLSVKIIVTFIIEKKNNWNLVVVFCACHRRFLIRNGRFIFIMLSLNFLVTYWQHAITLTTSK